MPYLPPPQVAYPLAYEQSQAAFVSTFLSGQSRSSSIELKRENQRLASIGSESVNPESTGLKLVDDELRSLLLALPEIEITPAMITAQAGPVKPGSRPLPKPTDPKIVPLPPRDNKTPLKGELLNVKADSQEYNAKTGIFIATGNVVMKYQKSELKADKVQVNLGTKVTIAEGNVFFVRGDQRIRGSRLEYAYGTQKGTLANAIGSINLGTLTRAEASKSPADLATGSTIISLGRDVAATEKGQDVRRLGFQSDLITLDGDRWQADNLRITNDPFSPPELELRTTKATLVPISPTQDKLEGESPTLVFDQGLTIPLPVSRVIFDKFQRSLPLLVGYDRQDRGGLFYQQDFDLISQPDLSFQISPQIFVQRGIERSGNIFDTSLFGLVAKLESILPDNQFLSGRATLSGLDFSDVSNSLRANVSYSRPVFDDHSLVAQYAFRERFFNGSLGFQDVRNSLGLNIFSPNKVLGDSGISYSYQAGGQFITADRGDTTPGAIGSLVRLQGAVALSRGFQLWRGTPLPAEKETGLKYSPEPIVPKVDAVVGLSGIYSLYSTGASQGFLSGTIGLSAVLGNFSQTFFDYTRLNLSYSQGALAGESPFFFDRIADKQTITAGILQQIYGPVRFGLQQTWNPVSGKVIDSTYSLQYDRRTYAVIVRYNPVREIGELVLRISDFNWNDRPSDVTSIDRGIERRDN